MLPGQKCPRWLEEIWVQQRKRNGSLLRQTAPIFGRSSLSHSFCQLAPSKTEHKTGAAGTERRKIWFDGIWSGEGLRTLLLPVLSIISCPSTLQKEIWTVGTSMLHRVVAVPYLWPFISFITLFQIYKGFVHLFYIIWLPTLILVKIGSCFRVKDRCTFSTPGSLALEQCLAPRQHSMKEH